MVSWWWLIIEFIACGLDFFAFLILIGGKMEHRLRKAYLEGISYASKKLEANKLWRYNEFEQEQ